MGEEPNGNSKDDYNPLFAKFVDDSSENSILSYIAYGLYKHSKREWVAEYKERHGRSPEPNEVTAYVSSWTASRIEGAQKNAAQALSEYAEIVIEEAAPQIRDDALRGSWTKSIFQSIVANFLYTIFLILLALLLAYSGVDLIAIIQGVQGSM